MKIEHVDSLFFFMSIFCLHYVWRLLFVQPMKQLESGNKIPITQIAP